jgi:hypothetical protein
MRAITDVFRTTPDKRRTHERCRSILQELAADPAFLTGTLVRYLRTPGVLNRNHYPVITINLELNAYFGMDVNTWIPLPDRSTNLTTKAIHHHGNMLLTTVTSFGSGYEHWTFEPPIVLDAENELFCLRLIERAQHSLHRVAFVDSGVAHVPMFPADTSITVALWSNQHPTTWKDRVKRIRVLKANEKVLRGLACRMGLSRALDLKVVNYFDFVPTQQGFKGLKERTEFALGPNQDYLYSLFHLLQITGNQRCAMEIRRQLERGRVSDPALVRTLLHGLEADQEMRPRLSRGHYDVPFANYTSEQIELALAARSAHGKALPRAASAGVSS